MTHRSLTIFCDKESAASRANDNHKVISNSRKHFDMLHLISHLRKNIPIIINTNRVKGHQDDTHAKDLLFTVVESNTQYSDQTLPFTY